MSENRKNNQGDYVFTELSEEEINASSIFSKPQIADKKSKAPKKGLGIVWRTFLALGIVALLIVAILFINKRFGKTELSSNGESASGISSEDSVSKLEEEAIIKIVENDLSEVKKVTLKNKSTELDFYSEKNEADEYIWYIEGIDKELTDTESTDLTVGDCANPFAVMKREFSESEDYGFQNPDAEIKVELKDGSCYTLTVGKKFESGAMSGAYLRYSEAPETVYVLTGDSADYFTKDTLYYIQNIAPSKIEKTDENEEYFEGSITAVDYVELKGKTLGDGYRFEMDSKENTTIDYLLTKPYNYPANGEKVANVLEPVAENLETQEVLYFNRKGVPENILKKYSLNNPDFVLTYKIGNQKTVLKLATFKENSVYYTMTVNDGPCVYKITARSFEFLEQDYSYFVNGAVFLENINGISKMSFDIGGKKYDFKLSSKVVDGENEITVKYDGKTIDYDNFSNYYFYALGVNPIVSKATLLQERPSGIEKYFSIKVTHNKDIKDPDSELTVYKVKGENRRYYIEVDGRPMGLCETEYADMVYNSIEDIISNKEIPSPN